jgi:hypothetical protein
MEGMRIHASAVIPALPACFKNDSSNSQTNGDGDKNNKVCPKRLIVPVRDVPTGEDCVGATLLWGIR